jgi:hypothetical protein
MRPVVKVRTVNGSRFLAIPKEMVEKMRVGYMSVQLDASGRLVYTPVEEVT